MHKKAQAAIEFFGYYGWALLIILIAIGAIAYFGVQNPKKFLPDSCVLGNGLLCREPAASITGFSIIVQNGMGEDIDLNAISVDAKGINCDEVPIGELKLGQSAKVDIPCSGLSAGSRIKGKIIGSYTKEDSELSRSIRGDISSKVE